MALGIVLLSTTRSFATVDSLNSIFEYLTAHFVRALLKTPSCWHTTMINFGGQSTDSFLEITCSPNLAFKNSIATPNVWPVETTYHLSAICAKTILRNETVIFIDGKNEPITPPALNPHQTVILFQMRRYFVKHMRVFTGPVTNIFLQSCPEPSLRT